MRHSNLGVYNQEYSQSKNVIYLNLLSLMLFQTCMTSIVWKENTIEVIWLPNVDKGSGLPNEVLLIFHYLKIPILHVDYYSNV